MALFSQSPKPGPYVKEMNDAATFYTNRVLKDYKHRYVPSFTDQIFNWLFVKHLSPDFILFMTDSFQRLINYKH